MVVLLKKLFAVNWLKRRNVAESGNDGDENQSDRETILNYLRLISQTDRYLTQQYLFYLRRNHFSLFIYVKIRLFVGSVRQLFCMSECEL